MRSADDRTAKDKTVFWPFSSASGRMEDGPDVKYEILWFVVSVLVANRPTSVDALAERIIQCGMPLNS